MINTVTDDLLNQSQSVHLRRIVTVNEEGEERRSRGWQEGGEGSQQAQETLLSTKRQMCRDLRGGFRVISYSDFKDKSISEVKIVSHFPDDEICRILIKPAA